ncbi:heavy metal translocating P-type ATPase [uncultured Parabacteroides sp.]|uniref:heavy metal translocating P-type ATPase n=1 Tax=uncultured Parabacteroides sp. TaxID=512312 RepID=UPI00258D6044|nr:heavy metal translocating P-type ATPase [uncultured Parabacteroides sp.]
MGHSCSCNSNCHAHSQEKHHISPYLLPAISFVMLLAGIYMQQTEAEMFRKELVRFIWYLLAYLPVGLPVMKEAIESMREKDVFSEFTLMCIATLGAFYIGEYPEGVAVMLFYSIGEIFQDNAVAKARKNISALLDVRPETATVIRNNKQITLAPTEVLPGEIIEVKAGERVPLDGKLLSEVAAFNTAALTGESMPRNIHRDEEVLAGMIVTDKVIRIEVTKPYNQSALARILELVQNASERKAPAELFIRKFARIYTPIVTGLALLIVLLPYLYSLIQPDFLFIFNDWLYRALVFLVISCPCALVISIPLGYFGGIGAASRQGILFKGGNYLDAITKINTVVFDKTGTLTKGIFEVQSLSAADHISEKELLRVVASVESRSNHPIAKAILAYAREQQTEIDTTIDTTELAGYGLKAVIDGKEVLVGNTRLLDSEEIIFHSNENEISSERNLLFSRLNEMPETVVVCAIDGQYAGYILLADTPKEDAATAIKRLKELNINNLEILSGDKQIIVSKLASRLGIPHAYGDLLPEGKVAHLEELKRNPENRIAFVGDGINDAPVLALSDIGIAMGGLGSDAAIETADVVIQTDQPSKVATAIRIGKFTRSIVWQNIALAFGVKLIVLILGAGGVATMWEAVFADVGVALLAILNAVRILKTNKQD